MHFRIRGLSAAPFQHLFGLSDAELAVHGARRCIADTHPGFPDRIEMRDAAPGESLLLLNYQHQPADTPYRSAHAIYVLEGATHSFDAHDTVPAVLRTRMLSLRAFDAGHMMVAADLVDGREVEHLIDRLLADPQVAYIHAHYARRGCYAGRIERG